MGVPVLCLGASGSGKSASMRNLKYDDVGVFNVAGKPLPFKGNLRTVKRPSYSTIMGALKKNTCKTYVIDDSQYLMAFEMFDKAKVKGYDKFTEIAVNFEGLIRFVTDQTTDDTIVYFLHHTEETDTGRVKAKTVGKMLDNQITLEGLFSIVLIADRVDGEYVFRTTNNGDSPAKSPMGMFEPTIPNDLQIVTDTIREYYGLEETVYPSVYELEENGELK